MKRSGLILRQEDAKEQASAVASEVTELAAHVFRVALTDTLGAKPEEKFSDALDRRIDARIIALVPLLAAPVPSRRWWRFWA